LKNLLYFKGEKGQTVGGDVTYRREKVDYEFWGGGGGGGPKKKNTPKKHTHPSKNGTTHQKHTPQTKKKKRTPQKNTHHMFRKKQSGSASISKGRPRCYWVVNRDVSVGGGGGGGMWQLSYQAKIKKKKKTLLS